VWQPRGRQLRSMPGTLDAPLCFMPYSLHPSAALVNACSARIGSVERRRCARRLDPLRDHADYERAAEGFQQTGQRTSQRVKGNSEV
jgi:hypothetical protein